MSTVYLRDGRCYLPNSSESLDMHEKLPPGNFIVKKNPNTGALYFEQIEYFPKPKKLYGTTTQHAERILNTFADRPASTGILLNGEKGSGKTLLAKVLSLQAAEQGIPTIVINAPWCGDQFNQLIQGISQPAIVMFDEFEKIYDREEQEAMLTLLDGVFPTKKLFILTCNDKYRVDAHMRNRPGRIFYMLDFTGLEPEFIREYCEDNLKEQSHIDTIIKVSMLFDQFNFDMLKALIEEMNRYNEDPHEALKLLNAKPQADDGGQYNIEIFKDSKKLEGEYYPSVLHGNPLRSGTNVSVYLNDGNVFERSTNSIRPSRSSDDESMDDDTEESTCIEVNFVPQNLRELDAEKGTFVFETERGFKVVLTRKRYQEFNYRDAF